jgi:hypothetical protein
MNNPFALRRRVAIEPRPGKRRHRVLGGIGPQPVAEGSKWIDRNVDLTRPVDKRVTIANPRGSFRRGPQAASGPGSCLGETCKPTKQSDLTDVDTLMFPRDPAMFVGFVQQNSVCLPGGTPRPHVAFPLHSAAQQHHSTGTSRNRSPPVLVGSAAEASPSPPSVRTSECAERRICAWPLSKQSQSRRARSVLPV